MPRRVDPTIERLAAVEQNRLDLLAKEQDREKRLARAVKAFKAARERGHEPWEACQAAFVAAWPGAAWDTWTRAQKIRPGGRPVYGYRLPLGELAHVEGAGGYGWHSVSGKRPAKSLELDEKIADQTAARMLELAGETFSGQVSLPWR